MYSQKYQTTYSIRSMKYLLEALKGGQIRMTVDKAVHRKGH